MLDIVMTALLAVLIVNLLVIMVVMGRRAQTHSWLLAILLSGTTGAALAAILAGLIPTPENRFVDLSLVLMGLAVLPVLVQAILLRREKLQELEAKQKNSGKAHLNQTQRGSTDSADW